jgi:hypothetical protein
MQHYRLTLSDAIVRYQNRELTVKGLLRLYFEIRLKPGWTMRKSPKEIYTKLGISRAAFYNAFAQLREEGTIEAEDPDLKLLSIKLPVCERGQQSTNVDKKSTNVDKKSTNVDGKSPELSSNETSGSSSNFFQLFLNSLSDKERENFWEFGRGKAASLPTTPELPDRWITANWEELQALWLKNAPSVTNGERWAHDPRRDEWLAEIRLGKPRWIAQGDKSLSRQERKVFAEWALANNLVWEVEA